MTRRKKQQPDETIVDIVEAKEQAQDFFERNQMLIIGIAAAVVLVIGGLFAYKFLYQGPRNDKAADQMFQAQFQFERDSFALALENPGGGYDGFLDIIDNYSGTKAANLAHYYAGVSYLHLGRYEAAIDYLTSYKAKGKVMPIMKHGTLGDAYSELGNYDKALAQYKKAAESDNSYLAPYYLKKYGLLQERLGNLDKAAEAFAEIKEKYPESTAGRDIEKYIARVEMASSGQ